MSRIESSGIVVSESLLHTSAQAASTLESLGILALTPRSTNLGLQMQSFQGRVLRLQQVVCICEEVRVIANTVALEGMWVAEDAWGVLTSFDGDTLVGDEIANEGEDYK
jgi:hypothetical protein